jgi:hypothetical protein
MVRIVEVTRTEKCQFYINITVFMLLYIYGIITTIIIVIIVINVFYY